MASERQLSANRANARLSTGPKTPQGKVRSSLNALTHGLTAQAVVLEDEDPEEFERFREELIAYFQPGSLFERELVDRIVGIMWRMRRIPTFEACVVEARRDEICYKTGYDPRLSRVREGDFGILTGYAFIQDSENQNALGKLSRHEAALMNQLKQTLQLLQMIQSQQSAEEDRLIEAPDASDRKNAA